MKCPSCQAENLPDSRFCHKCATPLSKDSAKAEEKADPPQTPHFDFSRGDVFAGRYEIIEDLGQGGRGKVYKVLDRKTKKTLALKLIWPEAGIDEKAVEGFRNELKLGRKISAKNICRIHDLAKEGPFHYITMDYVEGEDLKSLIRMAGQLTLPKSLSIAGQVCKGLGEAHKRGVVHRDLKPQNIMIDKEGNARIMDFGIAWFRETEGVSGPGAKIGTPEYLSPEQAELKGADKRSDIYSLGAILYEMLSGSVSFEKATPPGVAAKHKAEKPEIMRELGARIPPGAAAVISRCMEKDPGKRYQTTEDLIADLDKLEKGTPTPAGEKEPPPIKEPSPVKEPLSKKEAAPTKPVTVKPVKPAFQAKQLIIPAVLFVVLAAILVWQFVLKPKGESEIPPGSEQAAEETLITGAESAKTEPAPAAKDKTKAAFKPKKTSTPQKQDKKASDVPETEEAEQQVPKPPARVVPRKPALTETETRSLELSKARLNAAKIFAQNKGLDAQNLLFQLAGEKELAAETAVAANDFLKAKSLFKNVEALYRLSVKCKSHLDCAKALQGMADDLRKKTEKKAAASSDFDVYETAKRFSEEGLNSLKNNDYENASRLFFEAIFLYDKIASTTQLKNE